MLYYKYHGIRNIYKLTKDTIVISFDIYFDYHDAVYVTGFWKITHMGANDTVNI